MANSSYYKIMSYIYIYICKEKFLAPMGSKLVSFSSESREVLIPALKPRIQATAFCE